MQFKTISKKKFEESKNKILKENNIVQKQNNIYNIVEENNSFVSKSEKTIFIHPACFNEDEIYNTIKTAYEQANNPDGVYFGLYNQRSDGIFEDATDYVPKKYKNNIIQINSYSPFTRGVGLARLNSLMLHRDQDYGMQIDAHTIFKKDWDKYLINQIEELKKIHEKSIISFTPFPYEINEDSERIIYLGNSSPAIKIINKDDPNFYFANKDGEHDYPAETFFVSGNFIFADLSFFKEIFPDPRIAFGGEEHTTALRACTRGYKIFVTKESPIFSLGKTEKQRHNTWSGVKEIRNSDINFGIEMKNENNIVNKILSGKIIGDFGAPTKESYEEYIKNIKYDYRTRTAISD